jgi:FlaA1/EpsC-like NDP-sugar epimerase
MTVVSYLIALERHQKVGLLLGLDTSIVALSAYLAVALRLSTFDLNIYWLGWLVSLAFLLPLALVMSVMLSVPWIATRTFSLHSILRLGGQTLIVGATYFLVNYWGVLLVPRSAPLIFLPVLLALLVGSRVMFSELVNRLAEARGAASRVLIYGAGSAGQQLANAMHSFPESEAVAFVDDNPALRRVLVGSLRIHPPEQLERLIESFGVTQIILAMPSAARARKQEVLQDLQRFGLEIRTLPHFVDFITNQPLTDQLRTVTSEDLLGRLPQALDIPEINAAYAGKCVLVTGAGGSIGSELVMQMASVPVARLVLYEHSEVALYDIERRLRSAHAECEIVPVLASVLQQDILGDTLSEHRPDVVLHAAAYKHVPLVERNEVAGARNNAIGTYAVAKACAEAEVGRFILISTDKAVRPTNVMGATKRFAEMLVQDLQTRHGNTVFSMVRFGNVLDSSGSVIPLFREQIAKGGPLTVTDPEVTRFFMTIGEAARLVLLAGTFAKGGEVYVLDMGAPVKIADLARNMIRFCGLTERTPQRPEGEIEVQFVGLRPGEKLYEELLIGENQIATPHPKIMCAREMFLSQPEMDAAKARLERAIETRDAQAVRALFLETVDGYTGGGPAA